jgi:hypothetical protein
MPKKPSLAASLNAVRDAPGVIAGASDFSSDELVSQTPPDSRKDGRAYFAATREGKKKATVTLTPEDHRRLKRLSADTGRSIELLMTEAVQNLFRNHSV